MNIEELRTYCNALPEVTEDVKWGNDLCFCIGGKMFAVTGLTGNPVGVSFKVRDDEFEELCATDGFVSAPYVGRYKWVYLNDTKKISKKKLEAYLAQSYNLIKAKLPKGKKK